MNLQFPCTRIPENTIRTKFIHKLFMQREREAEKNDIEKKKKSDDNNNKQTNNKKDFFCFYFGMHNYECVQSI